jgi:hypothetical protein
MCPPPFYSSAEEAGQIALHSRLPQQSHLNFPTRLRQQRKSLGMANPSCDH